MLPLPTFLTYGSSSLDSFADKGLCAFGTSDQIMHWRVAPEVQSSRPMFRHLQRATSIGLSWNLSSMEVLSLRLTPPSRTRIRYDQFSAWVNTSEPSQFRLLFTEMSLNHTLRLQAIADARNSFAKASTDALPPTHVYPVAHHPKPGSSVSDTFALWWNWYPPPFLERAFACKMWSPVNLLEQPRRFRGRLVKDV